MMISTLPQPSPIRWSRMRVVAFEDAAWHEDGLGETHCYRVYTMRQIHGLQVMPDAAGRRRFVYLACVLGDGGFRLLGTGATLRRAQTLCTRYEGKCRAGDTAHKPNLPHSGVLPHADCERSDVVPRADGRGHSPSLA